MSPVIAEPFLRSACTDGHFQSNIFGWTLENSTLEGLMEYNIDGLQVNMTALNETMSQVSHHYHTKSFVQYAYWLIALLQVRMPVKFLCLLPRICCFAPLSPSALYSMPAAANSAAPTHSILYKGTIIIPRLKIRRNIATCERRSKRCKVKCIV